MPYIKRERRPEFDPLINRLASDLSAAGDVDGDLNYVICRLMTLRAAALGKGYHNTSETAKIGQDATDEFKRRVLAPYEDEKCIENGDVFTEAL